jgi:hypothetical protein
MIRDAPFVSSLYLVNNQLNFEDWAVFGKQRPPIYHLTIAMTDNSKAPLTSYVEITVIVVDDPEYPTFSNGVFSVDTHLPSGIRLGNLSSLAAIEDEDTSLTFSVDNSTSFLGEMSWSNCKTTCAKAGLQMPCIDGHSKNYDLISQLIAAGFSSKYLWVGMKNQASYKKNYWSVPGCTSTFTNFDNSKPKSTSLACVMMSVITGMWEVSKRRFQSSQLLILIRCVPPLCSSYARIFYNEGYDVRFHPNCWPCSMCLRYWPF